MKDFAVTVSVDATVAGKKLAAQEAAISLGVNAIPEISLSCAPTEPKRLVPLDPIVQSPTIAEYASLYRTLSQSAESLKETGDVTVRLDGDYKDELSLKGWILAGVGMSGIGATQAPHLEVILRHPICRLTKVGSICETPKSDIGPDLDAATEDGTNFLEVVRNAYGYVSSEAADDLFYPAAEGYLQPRAYRRMLGQTEFDPGEYLVCREKSIFLGSDGESSKMIARAIGRMAFPESGGSSTWDMILGASGTLLLSVVQDQQCNFTGPKLVIEPSQPWKKASITLDEDRCSMTEVPGMDPFRLIGVCARKPGAFSGPVDLGFNEDGNPSEKDPVDEVLYVPIADASASSGRIMKVSAPAFLEGAYRMAAQKGVILSSMISALSPEAKVGYNGAVGKYAKAVYEMTAASMCQAKASMVVMFRDKGGKLILPGNTCKFVAGGETVYYGYIRKVVHYLSTSGGNSTTVAMSYVRPSESYMIGDKVAIEAGSPNAAYE